MPGSSPRREWSPVAPSWERNSDHKGLWRRVTVLPGLALNRVELDLLGVVAGRQTCVVGVGEGLAALALASMGARVTAVDPTHAMLDILLVHSQVVGVDIQYVQADLTNLSLIRDSTQQLVYSAQVGPRVADLEKLYREYYRIMAPGGRVLVNEYHPFRRIWKQEPGSPRVAHSYFEPRREPATLDEANPVIPGGELARYDYHWTVSDQFHFLSTAGFRVAAIEEVGEVRQEWELPNLRGLPEQLIIAADKPAQPAPEEENHHVS